MTENQQQQKKNKKVLIIGCVVAVIMFFFCFAIVPFYGLICRTTGLSTAVPIDQFQASAAQSNQVVDLSREITVQFMVINHNGMPWDFYPRVKSVKVHPGQNTKVIFYAKNTTDKDMTVQALPSITPVEAVGHIHKIQCFCFSQQKLKAKESKEMPLIFNVDKELPKEVRVLTLAYTLFEVTPQPTARKVSS